MKKSYILISLLSSTFKYPQDRILFKLIKLDSFFICWVSIFFLDKKSPVFFKFKWSQIWWSVGLNPGIYQEISTPQFLHLKFTFKVFVANEPVLITCARQVHFTKYIPQYYCVAETTAENIKYQHMCITKCFLFSRHRQFVSTHWQSFIVETILQHLSVLHQCSWVFEVSGGPRIAPSPLFLHSVVKWLCFGNEYS